MLSTKMIYTSIVYNNVLSKQKPLSTLELWTYINILYPKKVFGLLAQGLQLMCSWQQCDQIYQNLEQRLPQLHPQEEAHGTTQAMSTNHKTFVITSMDGFPWATKGGECMEWNNRSCTFLHHKLQLLLHHDNFSGSPASIQP